MACDPFAPSGVDDAAFEKGTKKYEGGEEEGFEGRGDGGEGVEAEVVEDLEGG